MGDNTNEPEITKVQNQSPEDMVENPGGKSGEADVIDLEAVTGEEDEQANQIASMILAMQEENAQAKDRLLRATAEMENLRKRTQREVVDARAYAITDFARDMLGATDNLVRALAAFPIEARENAEPATKSLIEGIEMTEREMQRLMQKNGIKPIQAEGEKFNPHKHQAMFEVPDTSVPAGTVVQVVQAGFEIGSRVLRPAMVGVSKGGPRGENAPKADLHSVKIEPRTEDSGSEDSDEFDVEDDFHGHIDREV